MTAEEIRAMKVDDMSTEERHATDCGYNVHGLIFVGKMLQEIAAQFAEFNQMCRDTIKAEKE